jgi:hypothetical protein
MHAATPSDIHAGLAEIRRLRFRRAFLAAPIAGIVLCLVPLLAFDAFPLRSYVLATFIVCWPLAAFGFVASIPLWWVISETRCPRCANRFHVGTSRRFGAVVNGFTRTCMHCGLRLDGRNLDPPQADA